MQKKILIGPFCHCILKSRKTYHPQFCDTTCKLYLHRNILLFVLESIQNDTIEERVAILESQVVDIEEDLTGIEEDVTVLGVGLTGISEDVDFLFDEQVIQDERLFSLEQTTLEITAELVAVDDELESQFLHVILVVNMTAFFSCYFNLFSYGKN